MAYEEVNMHRIIPRGTLFLFLLASLQSTQPLSSDNPSDKETRKLLLEHIETVWDLLEKSKGDAQWGPQAVEQYNRLLQEKALSSYTTVPEKAQKVSDIDRLWLLGTAEKVGFFSNWLKERSPSLLYRYLKNLAAEVQKKSDMRKASVLVNYNLARKRFAMPPILGYRDIDTKSLNQLINETKTAIEMEKMHRKLGIPTSAQRRIIREEAVKVFGKRAKEIMALSTSYKESPIQSFALHSPYSSLLSPVQEFGVMLCKEGDYNYRIAVLYHEFGHIAYNMGIITNDLEKDWQEYMRYAKRGVSAFDNSSALGWWVNRQQRAILESLLKEKQGWQITWEAIRAIFDNIYRYCVGGTSTHPEGLILERKEEGQADLFAFRKLFEQQRITPLIAFLAFWISQAGIGKTEDFIIDLDSLRAKQEASLHPIPLVRALALAGFLADHGVDVNKELKKWENQGICIDTESIPPQHWPESSLVCKRGLLPGLPIT
jgi:hypothetical protein